MWTDARPKADGMKHMFTINWQYSLLKELPNGSSMNVPIAK
jgi:hypothetical protein